jgi:hypothetical protein
MKEENKVIGILVSCGALLSIVALSISYNLEVSKTSPEESGAVFIWNDDLEGIPANGHIEIDTIVNDTIYISPIE